MNKLDNLRRVFEEIDNNLKNSMIKKRIQTYNSDFDYEELVKTIKGYIDNFNVIKETDEDDLVSEIEKKSRNILASTKNSIFDVHSFTNDAIFLIEKVPRGNTNTNKKTYEKSPMAIGQEIEDKFYSFLLELSYPKESILKNIRLRINEKVRAEYDFSIQDTQKNSIAYIEVKSGKNEKFLSAIIQNVRKNLYFDKNVAFYLVVYLKDTQNFIYIQLDNGKEIYLKEFPKYSQLKADSQFSSSIDNTDWNTFIKNVDFNKLSNIKKNIKDSNYEEGERVRVFLRKFAIYLQDKIPELKSYKWKLNQASTQPQWTDDNGFRLSFYKGDSLPKSTQLNITFWASWHGGIFIKDNERLIFDNHELLDKLQKENPDIYFVEDKLHIMAIKFDNGMPKEDEVIGAIKKLLTILENVDSVKNNDSNNESNENRNTITNPLNIKIKKKSEIQSVLGVEAIANTLSSVLIKQFDESGMMIGIFGKWGRGKTHFSEKLWESLKKEKPKYRRVVFSAWKYQDTKSSWAYLYENMIKEYLAERKANYFMYKFKVIGDKDWMNKWKFPIIIKKWNSLIDVFVSYLDEKVKIWKLNIKKRTWIPIVFFGVIFSLFIIWIFGVDKWKLFKYLSSTFGFVVLVQFFFFYFKHKPSAIELSKKYFSKKSYSDYLGFQAEIEDELTNLLKTWVPAFDEDKKIILFVDDIDRCNIEQVIDIVDGLRVILDNPEIYNRVIIVTAIDETILKEALKHKYIGIKFDNNKIDLMYKEYLEKIFIIGIKLNELNKNEVEEILMTILPEDIEVNDKDSTKDTDVVFDNEDNNEAIDFKYKKVEEVESFDIVNSIEPDIDSNDVLEISIDERDYLKKSISNLKNATPRKIRIFYYKYLITRKLFYIKLKEKELTSYWHKEINEKIIIDLLIHLANGEKLDSFSDQKKEVFDELAYTVEMVSVL